MKKEKTLFISDVHLAAGKEWDWFNKDKEGPFLIKFFEYVGNRSVKDKDIKELVLLGDIFDLWVCPHDVKPHTFDEIIKKQSDVINAIKKAANKVKIIYINGNHDFRVTENDINKAFDGKVKFIEKQYRRGNVLAEHGHNSALFNRPDPINDPVLKLPLGYYITRLHTSLKLSRLEKNKMIFPAINELLEMAGEQKMAETVLDIMKDAVEKSEDQDVVEKFTMGHISKDQDYEDIRFRYQDLFGYWLEKVGYWQVTQMLMSEVNRLGSVADSLCKNGVDIVIFGHSHDTKMEKDSLFVKNRIYANCGYWCGFEDKKDLDDNAHFVETDGRSVSLFAFKGNGAVEKEKLEL